MGSRAMLFPYFLFIKSQGSKLRVNSHLRLKFKFCDLNKKLIAIRRPKISNKSDLFFFSFGFNLQKIVIKMADLSKQHGLSAFGLSVSPAKKRREDSCKTEESFLLLSDILHLLRFHSDYLQCTV